MTTLSGHTPDPRIHDTMQADHVRLDGLLEAARESMRAGDWPEAGGRFGSFAAGLRRHIRIEEELLFPAFEEATGMNGFGPAHVMRLEHLEIVARLDSLTRLLELQDAPGFGAGVADLISLLRDHNRKEEHVVYPLTDQSLPDEKRVDLIRRMQAL